MISMKVEDKYRVLLDGNNLPEEVEQSVLDDSIARLKDAAMTLQSVAYDVYEGNDVVRSIISGLMSTSCVEYHDGKIWRLDNLIYELEQLQDYLSTSEDIVLSYEEVETIFDHGFREYWIGSGIYRHLVRNI